MSLVPDPTCIMWSFKQASLLFSSLPVIVGLPLSLRCVTHVLVSSLGDSYKRWYCMHLNWPPALFTAKSGPPHSCRFPPLLCHRCIHPRGGVIQSVSSRKHSSGLQCPRQSEPWTSVPPPQNWSSPPEVVDLTLEEDSRRKYLL